MRNLALRVAALVSVVGLAAPHPATAGQVSGVERALPMTKAEDQIERFRQGEPFRGSINAFASRGKPDARSVEIFTRALRAEPMPVREQVAHLLVALGQNVDPLYASGGRLIRDPVIVSALIKAGLARQDAVRDYCLDTLQWHVPAENLSEKENSDALVANLKLWPDSTLLYVIAKAKPETARPLVTDLVFSPRWQKEDSLLVARAALGDANSEKSLVDPFLSTRDAQEKVRLAKLVGFIGTKSALTALASQMRTDLVFVLQGALRRSVRLDIMAALSYNFPDKLFLWDNAVLDDKGYARAEEFCEQTFGVHWDKPRPPFLTVQGFPVPTPK